MHLIKLMLLCFCIHYPAAGTLSGFPVRSIQSAPQQEYDSLLDISYGEAPGNDNLMDIHLPKERNSNTKVIVYIHGGSWIRGDKKEFPLMLVNELAGKRKYVVASINYRLVKEGKNIFPSQIDDVKKALAFLRAKAGEWKYDTTSFALMGASAGAHLALLYAYGYDSLKQVKTVVDIFGPTDLSDKLIRSKGTESNAIIENFLATNDTAAQIVKEASPLFHLNKRTGVPTLIFHGTGDELVPVSQSEKLYAQLKSLQIPSSLELYPGEKHELRPEIAVSLFGKIISWFGTYFPE